MIDLPTVRRLAAAALENVERHRGRINALNVYPGARRRHGDEPQLTMQGIVDELDRSTADDDGAARRGRAARRDDGGEGQLRRHPEHDRPRHGARPRRGRARSTASVLAEAFRAGATSAYQAVKLPVEGTMLTVIREMAEEAELRDVRALRSPTALAPRRRARRRRGRADARDARQAPRGGRRRRRRRRPRRARPRRPPRAHRRAAPRGAGASRGDHGGVDPPRGVGVPVLHGLRRRGRRARPRRDPREPRAARRLAARHRATRRSRRSTSTPTSRRARSTVGRAVGVVDAARVEIGDMHSQASERERWLAQLHAAAQAPPADDGARRGRAGRRQPRHPAQRGRGRSSSRAGRR